MAENKLVEKNRYMVGIYDHENTVIDAVKGAQKNGITVLDVYSPHPIHHLDVYIGIPRTKIPIAAFLFGATGISLALLMLSYMLYFDWPMIIGGKNYLPIPNLVPVSFEATVLISALGMVATFFVSNGMGPGKKEFMFDRRTTDDKYALIVDLDNHKNKDMSEQEIQSVLESLGSELNPKVVEK